MRKIFVKITLALLYVVSALPLRVHYFFSTITRFFVKNLLRYRYSVITTNIARSFPEMKYEEIKKLTNDYYRHVCDLIFESIWDLGHSAVAVRKSRRGKPHQLVRRSRDHRQHRCPLQHLHV